MNSPIGPEDSDFSISHMSSKIDVQVRSASMICDTGNQPTVKALQNPASYTGAALESYTKSFPTNANNQDVEGPCSLPQINIENYE